MLTWCLSRAYIFRLSDFDRLHHFLSPALSMVFVSVTFSLIWLRSKREKEIETVRSGSLGSYVKCANGK